MEKSEMELLNLIQSDFPIESRPFLALANKLNITEEKVIELVRQFKEQGYVRRLGGVFDSKRLGYIGTLCAMEVPKERIEEVAKIINSYNGVTHNYLRNHKYNMWFTLTVSSPENMENSINEIKSKTNIDKILVLTSLNTYKIKVNFNIEGAQ